MGPSQAQTEREYDMNPAESVGGDLHAKCFQDNSTHSAELIFLSENINSEQFIATFLHHMIVYLFTRAVGLK